MNDFDLKRIRDYLWTNCRGFEFRTSARIICKRLGFGRRAFHDACHRLMVGLGVPVVSEDAGRKKGVFIATCRADMDLYISRMDKRIDGELARRNRALELRDTLWPEGKPPSPEAPRSCLGRPPLAQQHLPQSTQRTPRNRGGRRRARGRKRACPPAPIRFYSYVCESCGAESTRAVAPESWPQCWEKLADGTTCMGRLKLLTAGVAEGAETRT